MISSLGLILTKGLKSRLLMLCPVDTIPPATERPQNPVRTVPHNLKALTCHKDSTAYRKNPDLIIICES